MRRFLLIAIPFGWLLALFLVPFFIVVKISLSDVAVSIPPYVPQFSWDTGILAFLRDLCAASDGDAWVRVPRS